VPTVYGIALPKAHQRAVEAGFPFMPLVKRQERIRAQKGITPRSQIFQSGASRFHLRFETRRLINPINRRRRAEFELSLVGVFPTE
jgi:hypothetical protein